jgi:MFS family permease
MSDDVKSPIVDFIESIMPSRINTGAKLFLTGAVVNGVSNGIFNSIMQLYLITQGFNAVNLGKVFMFNPLFCAILSIPCGIAADRYGKKKMLLLGLVSCTLGIASYLIFNNFRWFAFAFAMFGVSNAAATVMTPLYTTFYEKHDLEKAFGLYGLINISAMSFGSLAGSIPAYMIANLTFTEISAYRIMIILASTLFIAQYLFYIASSRGIEETLSNGFRFKLDSWRPVIKFSTLTLFGNIAGGMLFALFPYYVNRKFGVASAGLGTLFFVSNLLMALSKGLAASIAKKIGNMNSIVFGVALSSVFFFLMPLSPSFGLLGLLYVLRSGTRFMSDPILASLFMKTINEDEKSTANSIRLISMNGGGVISPWLGGTLMENIGLDTPAYLGAGLTVILAALYPLLLHKEISESD